MKIPDTLEKITYKSLFFDEQLEKLRGAVRNACGPVGLEKGNVPKAPGHRDAVHAGIAGGIDIHVGVTDIDGPGSGEVQLPQSGEYRVRGGFFPH